MVKFKLYAKWNKNYAVSRVIDNKFTVPTIITDKKDRKHLMNEILF